MNKQNLTLGLVVIALLVGLGSYFMGPVKTVVEKQFGSLAGPDIPSPYLQWGGVAQYNASVTMVATSSVVCSIQNPVAATTTILAANAIVLSNAIAQAQVVTIATSTGQNLATSTDGAYLAMDIAVPASAQKSIVWGPVSTSTYTTSRVLAASSASGENPYILGPSQWVQFRIPTTTAGTFAGGYWTGNCNLRVQRI